MSGWYVGSHLSSSLPDLGVLHILSEILMQPHELHCMHKVLDALAMTRMAPLGPSFRELTRLLLHNVRYFPGVVTRKNLDDFIGMIQDPTRLAQTYDHIALLRQDL